MVVIYQLMIDLVMELFYESHILTQTTAKLELDNALIIQGFEVRTTPLKMCICLMASSTISECYKMRVWTDFGRVKVRTEIGQ